MERPRSSFVPLFLSPRSILTSLLHRVAKLLLARRKTCLQPQPLAPPPRQSLSLETHLSSNALRPSRSSSKSILRPPQSLGLLLESQRRRRTTPSSTRTTSSLQRRSTRTMSTSLRRSRRSSRKRRLRSSPRSPRARERARRRLLRVRRSSVLRQFRFVPSCFPTRWTSLISVFYFSGQPLCSSERDGRRHLRRACYGHRACDHPRAGNDRRARNDPGGADSRFDGQARSTCVSCSRGEASGCERRGARSWDEGEAGGEEEVQEGFGGEGAGDLSRRGEGDRIFALRNRILGFVLAFAARYGCLISLFV